MPDNDEKVGRDESIDQLIHELNSWLYPVESELIKRSTVNEQPVFWIAGLPRSGTTLLTQVLASTEQFAYPSNLIARFYRNVAIGARIQKVLAQVLPKNRSDFMSTFGRTKEWWEPCEFGFFWELHFPLGESHQLSAEQINNINIDEFRGGIAAWENEANKPIAAKVMHLDYHLDLLHEMVPNAVFLWIRRSHAEIIQSLLGLRKKYLGSYDEWFSLRPRDWQQLQKEFSPVEQVVRQIKSAEDAMEQGISKIPASKVLEIQLDEFCGDPHSILKKIMDKTDCLDYSKVTGEMVPRSFPLSSKRWIDDTMWQEVVTKCEQFGLSVE
ncbi:sulfotransferase [Calditrichota bacterium]